MTSNIAVEILTFCISFADVDEAKQNFLVWDIIKTIINSPEYLKLVRNMTNRQMFWEVN